MSGRTIAVILGLAVIRAVNAAPPALDQQFDQTVRPFIATYCVGCHSGKTPAAQFDLKSYTAFDQVTRDYPRWALILQRLTAHEMPPKPAPQPSSDARQQVIDWIQAVRADEIRRNAGDPGAVLARRLSNAEYNYTIRDLTGADMQPAREFPVDPANPAGFDNSGESLTMSPALVNKYLQAAREVASHMVLTPDGINFAAYPMLVETDREKYCIERILNFYAAQPTDFAGYFYAAWRYKSRAKFGKPDAALADIAAEQKVSPKYLTLVWQILQEKDAVGPIAKLQRMWRNLPDQPELARAACLDLRDFVIKIRSHTAMQFAAPIVKGLPAGSQPLLSWKNRAFASHRRDSDPADLRNDTGPPPLFPAIPRHPGLHDEAAPRWAALTARARANDEDLVVPPAERRRYEAAFARFASVFPDAFYVKERGRYFPDDSEDKGRFLSAGYHNTMGYFRDDTPLMELILDEKGQRKLNRLWNEFDFIAEYTAHTWIQYFINQSGEVEGKGSESGSPRPTDHEITDAPVILGLRDAYVAKALAYPKNDPAAVQAIRDHFNGVNETLRALETEHKDTESKHLEALLRFAARAYRRPLSKSEENDIVAFYQSLRTKNGLSHEDAIRDSLASILMSPDFLYRVDLLNASKVATPSAPLSSYALASRLSYFLWSSTPDDELLQHAASADLQTPSVLIAQTRRMLKESKVRALATEFGGNWLDFRHFETVNTVDRDRFPSFDNDLREAMFQEPVRFIQDVINNDRSVLDMVFGDYTFVNSTLARHYGMPEVAPDRWVRVDNAGAYQRGGILPMAVFLTQNAPGLRTSPVKRGYWVVRRVLGEVIPPPPPVVPELPADEGKSDLPLRDMLVKHRSNPVCASCHARFDSFGLAFEGYGPIGETRTTDLAARPIPKEGIGLESVRAYIREHRQQDFVDNLTRKLVAYALNRSLQLSDESLIDQMKTGLQANGYRFDWLIEAIVTSPQFLNKRTSQAPSQPLDNSNRWGKLSHVGQTPSSAPDPQVRQLRLTGAPQ